MPETLNLSANLNEKFILIPASTTVAEALARLREAGNEAFAVVGDIKQPQTLVQEEQLANLDSEKNRSLSEVLDQFPSLLVVDGEVMDLDIELLEELADLLGQTEAVGLVVYQNGQVRGIIPADTIMNSLPPSYFAISTKRDGDILTPARRFVCRKCKPPAYRFPRESEEPPPCPNKWLHGAMERG